MYVYWVLYSIGALAPILYVLGYYCGWHKCNVVPRPILSFVSANLENLGMGLGMRLVRKRGNGPGEEASRGVCYEFLSYLKANIIIVPRLLASCGVKYSQ